VKKTALFILAIFLIIALPVYAAAKQIAFSSESGNPGDTVTVSINVDSLEGIAGYNIDFTYDRTILTATGAVIGADVTGTFIPNINTAGEVKLGLIGVSGNTSTSSGKLATVSFTILANAYKNSLLAFTRTDLKDENGTTIDGMTSTDGSIAVTGVTTSVVVTPTETVDVVAGQAVTLTAEMLVNNVHIDLTNTDDITLATASANGAFGAKSLVDGKVQVDYTTHTAVETANITATENITGGNNKGTATVTSVPGALATLTVNPDTKTLTADESQQLTVTGVDANDNATDVGGITWNVNNGIGSINTTGLFDATTVGTGTITATSDIDGVSDTTGDVIVTAGVLAMLTVSPDTANLTANENQQFSVAGLDANGNTTGLGTITWSVTEGSGTIDATGLFVSITVGTSTVTATSSHGPADSSGDIAVSHGAATKIDFSANPVQISSSAISESTLTATILDQYNNTVTSGANSTQYVSFAVTDNTHGDIKTGEITVAAIAGIAISHVVSKLHDTGGNIPCTANAGALPQATVAVTTAPRTLVTIDIEIVDDDLASNASPNVGETVQFKAKGTYDDESTDDITESVTWNSLSNDIGTIETGGLFNAVAEGTTNVTATLAEVNSNSVVMNVQAAEPVVFDTTKLPETMTACETVDFNAATSGGTGEGFTYTFDSQPTSDPGILTDGKFSVDKTMAFAGVYVISATDNNSGASVNHTIKIPMKLEPNSFVMRENAEDQTFTLTGAPNGTTFTLTQYDLDGNDVGGTEGYGESNDGDGMSPVEEFTYTPDDIDEIKSFTVKFVADTPDDSLEDSGLHELESGIYRVIPVNIYSGYIQDSNGNGLNGAIVKVTAPARYAETQSTITNVAEAKDGYFEFIELPDTGATYTFIATLDDYVVATFTSNDLAANNTVTLIDAAVYIVGVVTPAGVADVCVFYDEQDNPVKIGSTTSAVDGSYRIDITEDPGAATYYVTASSSGFFGKSGDIAGPLSIDNADVTIDELDSENEVNAKFGGSSEVTTVAGQQVSFVEIPPVSVDTSSGATSIEITVVTIDNQDSNNTSESGDLLYEIKAKDQDGNPVSSFIGDIIITLPFDLGKVAYDDLESGRILIRHADNSSDLIANIGVKMVDPGNIIAVDYVGDGTLGLVTFKVKSLSVFGIGIGSSDGSSSTDGTSLSDTSDDDRCFIATAAYGSPFESHVKILRNFRDVYLLPNSIGHAFVDTYYRYSPKAAAFITDHEFLRTVVRVCLMPVVGISYAALHTTAAQKMLIIFLMVSFLAFGYLAVRRLKIKKIATA